MISTAPCTPKATSTKDGVRRVPPSKTTQEKSSEQHYNSYLLRGLRPQMMSREPSTQKKRKTKDGPKRKMKRSGRSVAVRGTSSRSFWSDAL